MPSKKHRPEEIIGKLREAKLEKHLPLSVRTETAQYDLADADGYMDVHRPRDVLPGSPTIVWVHGGGFVSGRRSDLTNYAKILAGQGFVVVNVDYTIAPNAKYPTPVRQANKALGHLARNGQNLGVDPNRFVLAGDSAGAQIAAQTRSAGTGGWGPIRNGRYVLLNPDKQAGR